MTPKQIIEDALKKAIFSLVIDFVVKEYLKETEKPTLDDVPMLRDRLVAILRCVA